MQQARHARGRRAAPASARGDSSTLSRAAAAWACSSSQAASTWWSWMRPDRVLQPLQSARPRVLAAHGVLDLGRVAQPPDAAPQRVERVGQEAIAHLAEAAQRGQRPAPRECPDANERRRAETAPSRSSRRRLRRRPSMSRSKMPRRLAAAPRPGGTQPAQRAPAARRTCRAGVEAVLEQAQHDVHVPAGADRARSAAAAPDRPRDGAAVALARQQRERDAQAPARHADSGGPAPPGRRRLPELAENAGDPVLEQARRLVVAAMRVSSSRARHRGSVPYHAVNRHHESTTDTHPSCSGGSPAPARLEAKSDPGQSAVRMVFRPGDIPVIIPESERWQRHCEPPSSAGRGARHGRDAIRLLVAELPPGEAPRILEEASRGVLLGKDTFTSGRLGAATIEATLKALEGFRRIMDTYGVVRYRAVATSAVREAHEPRDVPRPRPAAHRDRRRGDRRLRGEPPHLPGGARGAARPRGADRRRRAAGRGRRRQRRHLVPAPGRADLLRHLRARLDPHAPEPGLLARQPRAAARLLAATSTTSSRTSAARCRCARPATSSRSAATSASPPTRSLGDDAPTAGAAAGSRASAFLAFCEEIGRARRRRSWSSAYRLPHAEAETLVPALLAYRELLLETRGRRRCWCRRRRCARAAARHVGRRRRARASRTSARRCWRAPRRSASATATTRAHAQQRGAARHAPVRRAARRARPRRARPAAARGGGAAPRHRHLREPARPPQARAVHAVGLRDLRPLARRHGGDRATSPATTAAPTPQKSHLPYMALDRERARGGQQARGASCAWPTRSTPTTCRR